MRLAPAISRLLWGCSDYQLSLRELSSKHGLVFSIGRDDININRQRKYHLVGYSSGSEVALSRLSDGVSTHTDYLTKI